MKLKLRRLTNALVVGAALTAIPELSRLIESETGVLGPLKFGLAFFWLPGSVVALIVSGSVHEVNEWVVIFGSFICYAALTYFGLWLVNRRDASAEGLNVHHR